MNASSSKAVARSSNTWTIRQVSNQLNVARSTLRFWEKELSGLIVPLRTPGGQRRYTPDHLLLIEEIKRLRQKGLSLADIKTRLGESAATFRHHCNSYDIDMLANQIAQLVKRKIHGFLQEQNLS